MENKFRTIECLQNTPKGRLDYDTEWCREILVGRFAVYSYIIAQVVPWKCQTEGPATRNDIVDVSSSTMAFNVAKIA